MDNIDVQIARMKLRIEGVAPSDAVLYETLERVGSILKASMIGNVRKNPNFPGRFPSGSKTNLIGKNSQLMGSFKYTVNIRSGGAAMVIAPRGVKYAKFHEFGGTIRAKTPFGMAVPYAPWVKGRGLRQIGEHLVVRKKNPTGKVLGVVIARSRFDYKKYHPGPKKGFLGNPGVSHLLLSHVDIPKRPFFFPAVRENIPNIVKLLREMPRIKP